MTTQGKTPPDVTAPSARESSTDGTSTAGVAETAAGLEKRVRQLVDDGKGRVTEWKDELLGSIREKPIQSILIATAVGTLLGLILGRRR